MKDHFHIALIGNPNSGKSSLFNSLTGLRQKVGNFTGVTVEKKSSSFKVGENKIQLTDLPGTYSLYPNSLDERIVIETLVDAQADNYPDAIVYVADITKLEKQTLLLTQLLDLGFPILWVLNMADLEEQHHQKVELEVLRKKLGIPILKLSTKTGEGLEVVKDFVQHPEKWNTQRTPAFYNMPKVEQQLAANVGQTLNNNNVYQSLLTAHHYKWLPSLAAKQKEAIKAAREELNFKELHAQVEETMARYDQFTPILQQAIHQQKETEDTFSDKVDRVLTHSVFGPLIFLVIMALVFQSIFSWAGIPMDLIEGAFGWLSEQTANVLPEGWFSDLLTEGIIAGLGGVAVFIPQIAILFLFISLLEEIGYMARVAFIWDRFMQFFGLNGRSTVALISGAACAIPAIMSARTIANRRERLITILITPFISCSARLPVYAVLIGFVISAEPVFGFFTGQGLAFLALYLIGILGGLFVALLLKWTIKSEERSFLALELPPYRPPSGRNVLISVWSKVKSFIIETGKIILVISIFLWFAAAYGPGDSLAQGEANAISLAQEQNLSEEQKNDLIQANKLEASYAGHFGKFIEPVIQPLGFDWKIGIALLTSFAAREVFVSTMATIYNIGSAEEEENGIQLIHNRMEEQIFPDTGQKVYTFATSIALLIFYVFALQCGATVAVIRKETGGWKWAIVIFIISLLLAYFGAMAAYQLLQ